MELETKLKIRKLFACGYRVERVAKMSHVSKADAVKVLQDSQQLPPPKTQTEKDRLSELQKAASSLIAQGYDPDVVRANFG